MSKYLLIILNFSTFLVGVAVLAVGIYGTAMGGQVRHLLSVGPPLSVLLLGALMTGTAGVGLWATVTERVMPLRAFFGAATLLTTLLLVSSALTLARRDDVDLKLYDAWDRAVERDQPLLEKLEKTYGCCGFATVRDRAIPQDCVENSEFGFRRPCRDVIGRQLRHTLKNLAWGGILLSVVQVYDKYNFDSNQSMKPLLYVFSFLCASREQSYCLP